ncbi:MAG: TonB-dependent receptor domain-containing protein [Terriglobia bacterium]
MLRKLCGLTLLIIAAGLLNPAWGQDTRGTILGRVLDTSGAIVPGVKVTVTKVDTGVTTAGVTNSAGEFNIPFLYPGVYRVAAQKPGFKTYTREDVPLRISEIVNLTVRLEVGSITQQVTVQATTPALDTQTGTPGQVISQRRLQDLPLQGGDAFELVRLTPGVVNMTNFRALGTGSPNGTSQISADGTPQWSAQWQIDGLDDTVNDTDQGHSRVSYIPPSGAINELKLQASPYDASVGHVLGPVISVSTKSGTNQFHGTAYYWLVNSALDASDFFANRSGQSKPVDQEHRYGLTFGGPLTIPHVYHGRDKTFFFFAWEGDRDNTPATTSGQTSTVPTAAERSGDFSALLKLGSQYQIYNPFTTVPAGNGRYQRSPIKGNVIPSALLNQVGMKLVDLYPLPNQPGTSDGEHNYFYPDVRRTPDDSFMGRLDHSFSENNRFFVRINHYHFHIQKNQMGILASTFTQDQVNQGAVLDDVWILSPTLVLNVRYGLTAAEFPEKRLTEGTDLTSLGFSPALASLVNPALSTVPKVEVSPFTDLSSWSSGDGTNSYASNDWVGDLTKQKGNQNIRFGADARILRSFGNRYPEAISPLLDFSTTYTRGPLDNSPSAPVGQQLAAMLMGIPGGEMVAPYTSSYVLQNEYLGLYVQDDYRLTPKLTVNLGIRYELESPPVEKYNRLNSSFNFTDPNALTAQAEANFAQNPIPGVSRFTPAGGLTFVGQNGDGRSPYPATNEFMPRIGLAWHFTPNTVLRSGYGIFFGSDGVATFTPSQIGFTQTTPIQASLNNGVTYVATLANPFPNGLIPTSGASGGINTAFGQSITYFDPNMKPPYSQRWSFGFERELPDQFVLDANYIGNKVTHLPVNRLINNTPAQYLSASPVRDQTTINYLSANYANPLSGLNPIFGTTIARASALEPFAQFGTLTVAQPIGNSTYNALQVRLEKRFSQGYTLQAAYTHSKYMQETEFLNPTDPVPYRTISDMDRPNLFAMSGIWEFPVGRSRQFLSHLSAPVNAIIGNWQLVGSEVHQSGAPLSWGNIIFTGNIQDISLPANKQSADEWFNVNAGFNTNSKQQLEDNIRTFPLRFSGIRAEGETTFNLALMKNYHLGEHVAMQFRAECYNVANHPIFSTPSTTPTSSSFGTITSDVSQPREWQFALKLIF